MISTVTAGLAALGIEGVTVQQADQPTTQGTPSGPVVLVSNVDTVQFGWAEVSDIWDAGSSTMNHTETQYFETRLQFGTLYPQSVTDTTGPTATDLLKSVRYIMQNLLTRSLFLQSAIGILRVEQIRQPYFTDDMEKFESSPSFDVILTHADAITQTEPSTNVIEPGIYPV